MTQNEFYTQISALDKKFKNRDLECYLLALYLMVDKYKDAELDAEKLLYLIQTAFSSEMVEFNEDWFSITHAPDRNIMNRKFTNPEIKSHFDKEIISDKTGIEFTFSVLRFQIADLHKMRDKQLKDEMRYFGVRSETGNSWYNFDPFTNLECGARCIMANEENEDQELMITWQTLGELLEMGRIYE